jgi:hypothetical protein
VSHLKLVVDNSAEPEPELLAEEYDATEELESEYEKLLLERDRQQLELEANQEYYESRLDPDREIAGLRLATWVRLGIVALVIWMTR